MELRDKILSISSKESFEKTALEVYHYQVQYCTVYLNYIKLLNWKTPTCVEEIPFLPIEFFKSHQIISDEKETEIVFKSSGTGGQRSTHFVAESQLYIQSFSKAYETTIGRPKDQVILALLPNYTEQGESSLVYMVDHLIKETNNELSGFLLKMLTKQKSNNCFQQLFPTNWTNFQIKLINHNKDILGNGIET